MTRRAGMSLTEVLVALFIMALGTIAILTLFPLGAIQMGQALRDDRTAQAATQADGFIRTYWTQNVCEPNAGVTTATLDSNLLLAFTNPSQAAVQAAGGDTSQAQKNLLPVTSSWSYPVVVDPMGVAARGGSASQFWVFGRNPQASPSPPSPPPTGTNLVRMSLVTMGTSLTLPFRTCSLLDGLGYNTNGLASLPNGSNLDRETRYNWLWLLQQPDVTKPTGANMAIVVFDKRTNLFAPPTAEQFFVPVAVPGSNAGMPGSTLVAFKLGGAPPVQKGDWLMDATVTQVDCVGNIYIPANPPPVAVPPKPPAPSLFQSPQPLVRNGNFYRVVSITDNPPNGTTDIELQTPLKPQDSMDLTNSGPAAVLSAANINPIPQPNQRQFVLMTGVADVFDRAALSYP